METTQKPRGEAPARRPREAETGQNRKQRPPQEQQRRREAPRSAQQANGALRTEEAQRVRPPRPEQPDAGTQERRSRPPEERPAPKARRPEAPQRPRTRTEEKRSKPKAPPAKKTLRRQKEPDDTLSSKRRSYGNSKPKKKSAVSAMGDLFRQAAQRSAARKKARQESAGKNRRPQMPTPAVIYTEPKVFNRNRFLMQMATVVAMVVALVLGLSVFFKVETITVSGAQIYSAWAVREASGIQEGDNLLSFGNVRAGAQIKANLPYVKEARLGIKLPDTVNIMIEEEDVVYAVRDQNSLWWLITSDGRVVEQTSGGNASSYTQILGVKLDTPVKDTTAVAVESAPTETNEAGEPIPVAVTGAQQLKIALEILKALEDNGIVGDAASVDVSRIDDIILWYGTRYQVNLGDSSQIAYKISCMNDAILQLSDYQSGILDISFTIWPDQIGYTPFA